MSAIEERESWLLARKGGIGASEVAAVVGLSPWLRPIDLWQIKTGQVEQASLDSDLLWWGTALEPLIAHRYSTFAGVDVVRGVAIADLFSSCIVTGDQTIVRRQNKPWVLCTPDGIVLSQRRGLEMKCSGFKGEGWGSPGSEDIPDHYRIQVCWQMAACNYPSWDVAALFRGNTMEVFRIRRDFDLEAELVEAATAFWHDNVLAEVPPAIDESESYGRYLARKYSMPSKQATPCTERIAALAADLKATTAAIMAAEQGKRLACNELMQEIGDAGYSLSPSGKVAWVRTKSKYTVDWEAAARYVGVTDEDLKQFTTEQPGTGYVRLYAGKEQE